MHTDKPTPTQPTVIIATCQRIKPDGKRCGSPALRGQRLCYHHIRPVKVVRPKPQLPQLDLTKPLEAQRAINLVFQGMVNKTIDTESAGRMLYAIALGQREIRDRLRRPYVGAPDFSPVNSSTAGAYRSAEGPSNDDLMKMAQGMLDELDEITALRGRMNAQPSR